jgi:6-pyruvoyltetrahydropterin/6-carboxytetrahydropterin synthase
VNQTYSVLLEKQSLIFSAAHFITFGDNTCERIHGHNYRVRCEINGNLESNGYVIDFIALRDSLQKITTALDHHVLLATEHPTIHVKTERHEVHVTFENRRWVFPKDDCLLLPIANTTAELLANYIGQQLIDAASAHFPENCREMMVAVDENEGQWGVCRFSLNPSDIHVKE